jgi:hypothetical protein
VQWTAQTGIGFPDQPAAAHLDLKLAGYVQPQNVSDPDKGEECYVVVDMAGSTVSPGQLIKNDNENRGYYTHGVLVQMSFDPASSYLTGEDAPEGSAESGSQSTSSSESETIGFFGDTLTGSLTSGSSAGGSRSFPDFEVTNLTLKGAQGYVKHQVTLKLCDGGAYYKPASLIDTAGKGYLFGLPPRAEGNLPLTSAGSFVALTKPTERPPKTRLTVSVEHQLAIIVWHADFFSPAGAPFDWPFDVHDEHLRVALPMETGEYEHASDYKSMTLSLDVDWDTGDVTLADDGPGAQHAFRRHRWELSHEQLIVQ